MSADRGYATVELPLYERKALVTLMVFGVADAASICREGAIPTSKMYRAMESLAHLGGVEIQPSRPRMYSALPPGEIVDRVVDPLVLLRRVFC